MVHKTGPRPNVVKEVYEGMKVVAMLNDAYYPEIIEASHKLTMYIINEMGQTIDKYEPCEVCPADSKRKAKGKK